MLRVKIVFAFLLLIGPLITHADLISVDRAAFQGAVAGGTISSEDFDALADGTILGVTPDVTYGASGGDVIVTDTFLTTTVPNGIGSTSAGFFTPTESAIFTFSSAITAFAIDINTFASTDGAYSALLDTSESVLSIFEAFPNFSTGQFLGFVSDTPFSQITISANTGFSYTLDTLVYGDAAAVQSVPEPGTLALLGLGLVGMAARRRKKV